MKIAFISSGSSIHVLKLANELVKNGHELHLYTLPNHDSLISNFDNRILIIKLKIGGKFGYYLNSFELRKKIRKGNYDVINAHYASGYGTLLRLVGQHPTLLSVFGSDVFVYPFRSRLNMHTIIRNLEFSDVIASTSAVMANKIREFYSRERVIHITSFGVDTRLFNKCDNNSELKDQFIFGIIKKIEDVYGHKYLLQAFKLLIEAIKDKKEKSKIQLKIYGRGSKEEEYKRFTKEIGMSRYVQFCGFIQNEDVPLALNNIDVVCLPSISESFGVSAIEAMACEIPVITSDAEGFTEIIVDNVTGFIVPKQNVEVLFEKMFLLYKMNKVQRSNIGKEGRKRVLEHYNFKNNIQKYIRVLEETKKMTS